jgi:cytochrome b561
MGNRYTTVAIVLHWSIAAMILYNLVSGLLRQSLPNALFALHETSGISILLLSAVRVVWRLTHRPPPSHHMKAWQRTFASAVHAMLYLAMLVLPLSGWALVSATPPLGSPGAIWYMAHLPSPPLGGGTVPRPHVIIVFGRLQLPGIGFIRDMGRAPAGVGSQRVLHEAIKHSHLIGGWVMVALIFLHLVGALKQQMVDGNSVLTRMGIGNTRQL